MSFYASAFSLRSGESLPKKTSGDFLRDLPKLGHNLSKTHGNLAIHKDPSMTRAPCRSGRRVRSHLGLSSEVWAALRDTSYRMLLVQGAVNLSNLDIDFVGKLDLHFGTILLTTEGFGWAPMFVGSISIFLDAYGLKTEAFRSQAPTFEAPACSQATNCPLRISNPSGSPNCPDPTVKWTNPTMTGDKLIITYSNSDPRGSLGFLRGTCAVIYEMSVPIASGAPKTNLWPLRLQCSRPPQPYPRLVSDQQGLGAAEWRQKTM